ncbi:MAG: hypothetical protein ABIC68_01575 [Candidatus Omnitrophota bacterium]
MKKCVLARMSSVFLLCFALSLSFAGAAIADSSLDETIDALITLFEAKDYRAIVLEYSHPDAIIKMEQPDVADRQEARQEAIEKLIALQERFGGMTLKRLTEAKEMKPEYLNDGRDALFNFGGGYYLRFRKNFSGKWCLL